MEAGLVDAVGLDDEDSKAFLNYSML